MQIGLKRVTNPNHRCGAVKKLEASEGAQRKVRDYTILPLLILYGVWHTKEKPGGGRILRKSNANRVKSEVDALGVITIPRGCFERCCSNKKTPPYHSKLSFLITLTTGAARSRISRRRKGPKGRCTILRYCPSG